MCQSPVTPVLHRPGPPRQQCCFPGNKRQVFLIDADEDFLEPPSAEGAMGPLPFAPWKVPKSEIGGLLAKIRRPAPAQSPRPRLGEDALRGWNEHTVLEQLLMHAPYNGPDYPEPEATSSGQQSPVEEAPLMLISVDEWDSPNAESAAKVQNCLLRNEEPEVISPMRRANSPQGPRIPHEAAPALACQMVPEASTSGLRASKCESVLVLSCDTPPSERRPRPLRPSMYQQPQSPLGMPAVRPGIGKPLPHLAFEATPFTAHQKVPDSSAQASAKGTVLEGCWRIPARPASCTQLGVASFRPHDEAPAWDPPLAQSVPAMCVANAVAIATPVPAGAVQLVAGQVRSTRRQLPRQGSRNTSPIIAPRTDANRAPSPGVYEMLTDAHLGTLASAKAPQPLVPYERAPAAVGQSMPGQPLRPSHAAVAASSGTKAQGKSSASTDTSMLEGRLELLSLQRSLCAAKCQRFLDYLESHTAQRGPKPKSHKLPRASSIQGVPARQRSGQHSPEVPMGQSARYSRARCDIWEPSFTSPLAMETMAPAFEIMDMCSKGKPSHRRCTSVVPHSFDVLPRTNW